MTVQRTFVVLASCAVLSLLPAAAIAQSRVDLPVAIGQEVRIDLRDGRTISGKVSGVSPQGIQLQSGDAPGPDSMRTRIAVADIRRVRERDSLRNGAVYGAVTLGLFAFLGASVIAESFDSAWGNSAYFVHRNSSGDAGVLALAGIGLVSGAVIGAGLDALRQKTLYERRETPMVVAVRPIVSAAGKGVGVSVRW